MDTWAAMDPKPTTTTTIEFRGTPFATAGDAIQHAEAAGGEAVRVGGRHLVVLQAEADRLATAGVEFAYLADHEGPDGRRRILAVPVN